MSKRGSWGDGMIIITPILYKKVSCATCEHYCHEDGSCLNTPIIPRINGYDYWKQCKNFELSREYYDEQHRMQVIREKGKGYFLKCNVIRVESTEKDTKHSETLSCDCKEERIHNIPKTFSDRFVATMEENYNMKLAEISMTLPNINKRVGCFVNKNAKIVAMTMTYDGTKHKFFHKVSRDIILTDLWSTFVNELRGILRVINDLPNSNNYEKWVVIPVIPYKEESCGEVFYKSRGNELKGTKLVEMDSEGNLLFATGPIHEKYWTGQRIKELEIFK